MEFIADFHRASALSQDLCHASKRPVENHAAEEAACPVGTVELEASGTLTAVGGVDQ